MRKVRKKERSAIEPFSRWDLDPHTIPPSCSERRDSNLSRSENLTEFMLYIRTLKHTAYALCRSQLILGCVQIVSD
jgi:hypothetical protein